VLFSSPYVTTSGTQYTVALEVSPSGTIQVGYNNSTFTLEVKEFELYIRYRRIYICSTEIVIDC